MHKYQYHINNLDCADCAREIEEVLNENENFHHAVVNFNTCKVSYESEKNYSLEELNQIIQKVEPEAYISLEEAEKKESKIYLFIIGLAIGLIGYFLPFPKSIKWIFYLISYAILLYRTSMNAVKLLLKGNGVNENALMTISCIGALCIGEVLEGIMVISLYTIGKILEEKAVNNSRNSIKSLLNLKEDYANRKIGAGQEKIPVEEVKVGDILVVKKGEKIPVDGIVVKGESKIDASALTGESEKVAIKEGTEVLSGSINLGDIIEIKATSLFSDSTVSKILNLLESATDKKTKTETLVSKISRIYTPFVIITAVLVMIFLPLIFHIPVTEGIYRGLTFLVISCPCAIAISVPLSYFTGIGVASKKGILIKGSNYLDNLSNASRIIFDKTGTLTNGSFKVSSIEIMDKFRNKYSYDEVVDLLRKGESFSNHPIAKSIMNLKEEKVDNKDVLDFKEIAGKGIEFTLEGKKIFIGNQKLCNCKEDAMLHLNIDGEHVASVSIDDGIKKGAKEVIQTLKSYGIKTYMFTGDKKDISEEIGKKLALDEVYTEMLPTDKFEQFERVSESGGITIFVGDGINDAPVLKRADIGISMGGVGSDSAIEASDVVLMKDDLTKILLAIDISKYTKKIIQENLIFALMVKAIILLLSVFGFANMWLAVFADTGVTLLTVINTLRIMKKYK